MAELSVSLFRAHVLSEADVLAIVPKAAAKDLRNFADRGLVLDGCEVRGNVRKYNFLAAIIVDAIVSFSLTGRPLIVGQLVGSAVAHRAANREAELCRGRKDKHLLMLYSVEPSPSRSARLSKPQFLLPSELPPALRQERWADGEASIFPADARINEMFDRWAKIPAVVELIRGLARELK